MVEIEFSAAGNGGGSVAGSTAPDVDQRVPGLPGPPARRSALTRIGRFAPSMLWAGAAGCALAAPFQAIYTLTVHEPGPQQFRETLDGWGRFAVHPALGGGLSTHEARYGVIYSVGAGLFALLALGALSPAIEGHNRWRAALQGFGIAAGSLVAAATATVVLLFQSAKDMTHAEVAQFRSQAPLSAADNFRIDLNFGGVVWFGAVAVGCAILGGLCLASVPRPAPSPPTAVAPLPALHPGDELLG